MIPSKPRLVVPYGLKTLLEGVSRAILRTNPPNITQFAALYFKELILFRDANSSLDIKDLVKQFHQIKVEKWSEGREEAKAEDEASREVPPPPPPPQPTPASLEEEKKEVSRQEKSTDTEEDNIAGLLYSNKTTQFPSFHAEVSEPEERPEAAVAAPSPKASSPKLSSPPPSPSPPPPPSSAASPELVYVPADPAQLAAQMLGNIASSYSEVLMVDVATGVPSLPEVSSGSEQASGVPSSESALGAITTVRISGTSAESVALGPASPRAEEGPAAEPSAGPPPDDPRRSADRLAPEAPSPPADLEVTSTVEITPVYDEEPGPEGEAYVEQIPAEIVIPFTDQIARLQDTTQSSPVQSRVAVRTPSEGSAESARPGAAAAPEDGGEPPGQSDRAGLSTGSSDTFVPSAETVPSLEGVGADPSARSLPSSLSTFPEAESWAMSSAQPVPPQEGVKPAEPAPSAVAEAEAAPSSGSVASRGPADPQNDPTGDPAPSAGLPSGDAENDDDDEAV
ncbi:calcium-binding tyrosine phosphorylation-regulated protein isoform X2 [Tachyglossus aculeatus]|uniref:calcium-binding tyrosine phosphorylation-regulated protein isoform X2 n=1 Tax=Tachyglossus aculeatus TaxID=9261 RepID=UPI0018F5D95B|nr:calcium-binding tyrosine phosphorylation-regulated protein isoform X2 [Tachyglossus aculeatus]